VIKHIFSYWYVMFEIFQISAMFESLITFNDTINCNKIALVT